METLFIIDGYYHIYRAFFAPIGIELTSPSGEPTTATHLFTTALFKLLRKQNPDMLVVAMEGAGKTFRSEMYSEYKVHRSCPSDDFIIQRNRIEEILGAMSIPVLRVDGYEADDIIGTVAHKASTDGYEVFICSNDKDMFQLLDCNTRIFNMKTGECLDLAGMTEQIGIGPEKFVDYLALQGDSADNIPGIPGVGAKTALQLLLKYGSVRNLIDHIDEVKGKRGDNLREFKDRLLLNQELITIDRDVPIYIDYDEFAVKEGAKDILREIFIELEFTRLLTKLDDERK